MGNETWWAMFIEYWETRGWKRSEIEAKVNEFCMAQDSLTDALLSKPIND